jgi:hypothetical protein
MTTTQLQQLQQQWMGELFQMTVARHVPQATYTGASAKRLENAMHDKMY